MTDKEKELIELKDSIIGFVTSNSDKTKNRLLQELYKETVQLLDNNMIREVDINIDRMEQMMGVEKSFLTEKDRLLLSILPKLNVYEPLYYNYKPLVLTTSYLIINIMKHIAIDKELPEYTGYIDSSTLKELQQFIDIKIITPKVDLNKALSIDLVNMLYLIKDSSKRESLYEEVMSEIDKELSVVKRLDDKVNITILPTILADDKWFARIKELKEEFDE